MVQVTLISGRERRRRWSSRDRHRILAAVAAPGAIVAEIARREEICTSLIYKWRREAEEAERAVGFAPVMIEGAPPSRPAPSLERVLESSVIVVEVNGAQVRIGADAPVTLVAATLKALRS